MSLSYSDKQALLESMDIMIKGRFDALKMSYWESGVIASLGSTTGEYNVLVNGTTITVKARAGIAPAIGDIVLICVPNGDNTKKFIDINKSAISTSIPEEIVFEEYIVYDDGNTYNIPLNTKHAHVSLSYNFTGDFQFNLPVIKTNVERILTVTWALANSIIINNTSGLSFTGDLSIPSLSLGQCMFRFTPASSGEMLVTKIQA